MDNMTFVREKLRRDAQELINHLDEAASAGGGSEEQKNGDIKGLAQCLMINIGSGREYMEAVKEAMGIEDATTEGD